MLKNIALAGITAILFVGFIGLFPQIKSITYALTNCPSGKCSAGNQNYKTPNNFKCEEPHEYDVTQEGETSASGKLDSRANRKSGSPYPGCPYVVKIKVKSNTCYKITLDGQFKFHCTGTTPASRRERDAFFDLFNLKKASPIKFNGQSLRSVLEVEPEYNSSHHYEFNWKSGEDEEEIEMYIKDSNYIDNQGKLTFTITEVPCEECPELQ